MAERAALLRAGAPRQFGAGSTLIIEGDFTTTVFVLLRGVVKVVAQAPHGEELLLTIRQRGELVGELAALDAQPRTASVVASTIVHTLAVDAALFLTLLDQHPVLARAVQRSITAKLRRATRHRVLVSGGLVALRVISVLDDFGSRYGRPRPRGLAVDVAITQQELATIVRASPASVQRVLAELRRDGIVATGYRGLHLLDPARLHELAEGTEPFVRWRTEHL